MKIEVKSFESADTIAHILHEMQAEYHFFPGGVEVPAAFATIDPEQDEEILGALGAYGNVTKTETITDKINRLAEAKWGPGKEEETDD